MRYGVEVLPPFVLASARYLIAGPIMLALSAIFKLKMRPSRQEWGRLAIIGVLMLGCGNTAVMWAEQYIPSGLAALLVASIPLYAALIEAMLPQGEGLPVRGWMVIGGLFNLGLMLASGGYHGAQWGMKAWGSIFYLVVFGSLITYTAYLYLLDNVAVSKVATYAYINPVIAVILGVIFVHERFVAVECVGMGATLLAIFLVTSAKMKSGKPNVVDVDLAVRQQA